jgi:hypothetical protein
MKYIVEQFGDIHGKNEFKTFDEALDFIDTLTKYLASEFEDPAINNFCDPEDNRITISEVLDTGHSKVVWHFSGWHWDENEFDLPQGKLKGHNLSLYEESNN